MESAGPAGGLMEGGETRERGRGMREWLRLHWRTIRGLVFRVPASEITFLEAANAAVHGPLLAASAARTCGHSYYAAPRPWGSARCGVLSTPG